MRKVNVFLPCRKGSQRVPRKNIKSFSTYSFGLVQLKLDQLLQATKIERIFLTTNDEEILAYAKSLKSSKIVLHRRKENLSSSRTSTDQLIAHALDLIKEGDILWTHVTSPFVTAKDYDLIVDEYFQKKEQGYDSLMTTTKVHGFLWDKNEPINYDRKEEKWPRTQMINPINEVNSAVFLANSDVYSSQNDRIGRSIFLYDLDKIKGFDVDWKDDFAIAEAMLESGVAVI